jgi:hypothetical protein
MRVLPRCLCNCSAKSTNRMMICFARCRTHWARQQVAGCCAGPAAAEEHGCRDSITQFALSIDWCVCCCILLVAHVQLHAQQCTAHAAAKVSLHT